MLSEILFQKIKYSLNEQLSIKHPIFSFLLLLLLFFVFFCFFVSVKEPLQFKI